MPIRNPLTQQRSRSDSGWKTHYHVAAVENLVHTGDYAITADLRGRHLLVGNRPGGRIAVGHLKTEGRVYRIDPVSRRLPCFAALQDLLVAGPFLQAGR